MRLLLSRFGWCRRCSSMASRTRARTSARRFRSSLTAAGARTMSNRIWPDYSQNCASSLLPCRGEHRDRLRGPRSRRRRGPRQVRCRTRAFRSGLPRGAESRPVTAAKALLLVWVYCAPDSSPLGDHRCLPPPPALASSPPTHTALRAQRETGLREQHWREFRYCRASCGSRSSRVARPTPPAGGDSTRHPRPTRPGRPAS